MTLLISRPNTNSINYQEWIKQNDVYSFLKKTQTDDYIPVFLIDHEAEFVSYSYFLPLSKFKSADDVYTNINNGNLNPYNSYWGWGSSGSKYKIFEDDYKNLEPLSFIRSFDARHTDVGKKYYELSQKLTQILGIHYVPHKHAYCTYDPEKSGDIIEVIKIEPSYKSENWNKKNILLFKKDFLDFYLWITKSVLIRWWDCTRVLHEGFGGWNNSIELKEENEVNFYSKIHIEKESSYSQGIQVIYCSRPNEDMVYFAENGFTFSRNKYETFIATDWHNNKKHEVSCNPNKLCNYFNLKKSSNPHDLSPVFFKSEVILKYKNDPEKYRLEERSIHCNNAWTLETYDRNERTRQVHTYLVYLGRLPHKEQLHWKQYNEEDKGGISERAYINDFKGDFHNIKTPIEQLKNSLKYFKEKCPNIWDSFDKIEQLNPMTSDSLSEWGRDISSLHNVIIDQIVVRELRELYIKSKNIDNLDTEEKKWKSIKLIKEILAHEGVESVDNIIAPLFEVNKIRVATGGHKNKDRFKYKEEAEKSHGSLQKHSESLITKLINSIKTIADILHKIAQDKNL